MIVEKLAANALVFHDFGACLCIGDGPVHDPILEQFVNWIVEPPDKTAPAPSGRQTPDAVKQLPERDRRKAQAFVGD
ncbi:MAG: hypothetical protein OXH76_22895 [Boseongicola sp.]|nr:hypothetical protein [Boseongicola sp.]